MTKNKRTGLVYTNTQIIYFLIIKSKSNVGNVFYKANDLNIIYWFYQFDALYFCWYRYGSLKWKESDEPSYFHSDKRFLWEAEVLVVGCHVEALEQLLRRPSHPPCSFHGDELLKHQETNSDFQVQSGVDQLVTTNWRRQLKLLQMLFNTEQGSSTSVFRDEPKRSSRRRGAWKCFVENCSRPRARSVRVPVIISFYRKVHRKENEFIIIHSF